MEDAERFGSQTGEALLAGMVRDVFLGVPRIPAVVGMRFEISDEAAITFAGRLYSAIAQGFPIDAAMAAVARDAQAVVTLNRNQTPTTATAA